MSLNEQSFEPALKQLYPSEVIRMMGYLNNPFYALIAKDETFTGESSKEPVVVSSVQNRSNSFSVANTSATNSIVRAFLVTRVQNYSMASIANETVLASESDKGAFLKALKFEMDKAIYSLTRSIAVQLYRSGTGSVARLSATAVLNSSVTPIALSQAQSITNIEYGMNLAFSAADGGALRAYASTGCYVVSIDRIGGTFQVSATFGGAPAAINTLITGIAVSDFVYESSGDAANGGSPVAISGLDAWLPGSAVTNTLFFNVDRTLDKTRLAGIVYDGSSQNIEEALIDGAKYVAREGGRADHCFVSYDDYSNLVKSLSSKQQYLQYTDVKVEEPGVSIGFNALLLIGPRGPIKVIPDQNCPSGKAYLLQMDTWKLKSLGEPARIFDGDSLTVIRDPSGDNLLVRCVSYTQLSCRAPGWNAVILLPQA